MWTDPVHFCGLRGDSRRFFSILASTLSFGTAISFRASALNLPMPRGGFFIRVLSGDAHEARAVLPGEHPVGEAASWSDWQIREVCRRSAQCRYGFTDYQHVRVGVLLLTDQHSERIGDQVMGLASTLYRFALGLDFVDEPAHAVHRLRQARIGFGERNACANLLG